MGAINRLVLDGCEVSDADDVDSLHTRFNVMARQDVSTQEVDYGVAHVLRGDDFNADVFVVRHAVVLDVAPSGAGAGRDGVAGGSTLDEFVQQPVTQ